MESPRHHWPKHGCLMSSAWYTKHGSRKCLWVSLKQYWKTFLQRSLLQRSIEKTTIAARLNCSAFDSLSSHFVQHLRIKCQSHSHLWERASMERSKCLFFTNRLMKDFSVDREGSCTIVFWRCLWSSNYHFSIRESLKPCTATWSPFVLGDTFIQRISADGDAFTNRRRMNDCGGGIKIRDK